MMPHVERWIAVTAGRWVCMAGDSAVSIAAYGRFHAVALMRGWPVPE